MSHKDVSLRQEKEKSKMPECLRKYFDLLSMKDAEDIADFLDGYPDAVLDMIEYIVTKHEIKGWTRSMDAKLKAWDRKWLKEK